MLSTDCSEREAEGSRSGSTSASIPAQSLYPGDGVQRLTSKENLCSTRACRSGVRQGRDISACKLDLTSCVHVQKLSMPMSGFQSNTAERCARKGLCHLVANARLLNRDKLVRWCSCSPLTRSCDLLAS